jgi:O-antigen/teichoic acid export membrane protein
MRGAPPASVLWAEQQQARTVALNVGWRYVNVAVELLLGLGMLPFNAKSLGASDYGLWVLASSMVAYFPVLDLGFGGAMERFVAHYRARRNAEAINEIASTLIALFSCLALIGFLVLAVIAWNFASLFNLDPSQGRTGGILMMLVSFQVAAGLPFAIYGAIVNAFQRTYRNAAVGITVTLLVAFVNVAVVKSGGTLVQLVAAMTAVRMLGYLAYRFNAYRVFPLLRTRISLIRRTRLKEVAGFSIYMLMQDVSVKLNYATDPVIIAAVMSTGAVAVWTVAQRLADVVLQMTNQLNYTLFPIVVDADAGNKHARLQTLLVEGTRLSLAASLPVAGSLALLAQPVVIGWTGHEYAAAALIVQVLAVLVIVRVGSWTASTVLQGGGRHKLVASSNLIAATVNVGLSFLLIRIYGLRGMAVATLIPVTIRAVAVLIPTACARVGISIRRFLIDAVWPAVWPAAIVLTGLAMVRDVAGTSLPKAVLSGGIAGMFYVAIFIGVAIGRADRDRYLGRLRSIAGWPALKAA